MIKLNAYDINSGYNAIKELKLVVSGKGISITMMVIIIARIASIKASNLSVCISPHLSHKYSEYVEVYST